MREIRHQFPVGDDVFPGNFNFDIHLKMLPLVTMPVGSFDGDMATDDPVEKRIEFWIFFKMTSSSVPTGSYGER